MTKKDFDLAHTYADNEISYLPAHFSEQDKKLVRYMIFEALMIVFRSASHSKLPIEGDEKL